MKQENAYKIKLLKLLEILRQDSDEDHYIGTTELIDKLADMGIVCDRRTLYKDIEVLNNFGYEVLCEKSPGKPNCYCVADRSFDVPELRILMDAVQAASFVTPSKTEVLLDKIADLDDLIVQSTEYCMTKVEDEFMEKHPRTPEEIFKFIDEIPYWTAERHGAKYRLMYQVYTHPKYEESGKKFFEGVKSVIPNTQGNSKPNWAFQRIS